MADNAPSGRGGGRTGTAARKFMPTMPGRRKKAEEGGAVPAADTGATDATFKDLIKQAQSAVASGGRGRGRGRHSQQRFQVTFGVGGEERPALAAAKQYPRSYEAYVTGAGAAAAAGRAGRPKGGTAGSAAAGSAAAPGVESPDAHPEEEAAEEAEEEEAKLVKPRAPVLDYSQYYPTMLPLRPPGEEIWEEADGGPGFLPSALDLATMPELPQQPAAELDLWDPAEEDQMFLMQIPAVLPLQPPGRAGAGEGGEGEAGAGAGGGGAAAPGAAGGGAGPGPGSERRRKAAAAQNRPPGAGLRELPSGRIGKLLVFRSGRVKMQVGDVLMDMAIGLPNLHRQDVVAVNPTSNACVLLGDVVQRVLVSPDVMQLLREEGLPDFRRAPEELAELAQAHRRARGYAEEDAAAGGGAVAAAAAAAALGGIKIKSEAG